MNYVADSLTPGSSIDKQKERIRQTSMTMYKNLKDHINAGGNVADVALNIQRAPDGTIQLRRGYQCQIANIGGMGLGTILFLIFLLIDVAYNFISCSGILVLIPLITGGLCGWGWGAALGQELKTAPGEKCSQLNTRKAFNCRKRGI